MRKTDPNHTRPTQDIDQILSRAGMSLDPIESLDDPYVKTYLLSILGSDLAPEMKYQRFIDLFRRERQIRERIIKHLEPQLGSLSEGELLESVDEAVAQVMKELQVLNPERVREDLGGAIRRALEWLANAQDKSDGGWAIIGDHSVFWETAFSTLCLNAAGKLADKSEVASGARAAFEGGVRWLNTHLEGWSFQEYPEGECLPVYNMSLAAICFYEIGQEHFGQPYSAQLAAGMQRLANSRCDDGGWCSRPWSSALDNSLHACHSEVGATSFAIRACLATGDGKCRAVAGEGVGYLLATQDKDGFWKDSYDRPSITKTCDALFSLRVAENARLANEDLLSRIKRAAEWLQSQEKPILRDGLIEGWGWDYLPPEVDIGPFEEHFLRGAGITEEDLTLLARAYVRDELVGNYKLAHDLKEEEIRQLGRIFEHSGYGYDSMATCLTLEVLVKLENPELSALVKNCQWLIKNQTKNSETTEGGCWTTNTARITLSLIEYYSQLQTYFRGFWERNHWMASRRRKMGSSGAVVDK